MEMPRESAFRILDGSGVVGLDVGLLLPFLAITGVKDFQWSRGSTKHFTKAVAEKTALRIRTPADFFRELSILFRRTADQEGQR